MVSTVTVIGHGILLLYISFGMGTLVNDSTNNISQQLSQHITETALLLSVLFLFLSLCLFLFPILDCCIFLYSNVYLRFISPVALIMSSENDPTKTTTTTANDGGAVPELMEDEGISTPRPPATAYQIVSIGTAEDAYAFTFDKTKFQEIITQIPVGRKVAVLSVVGAFRTGKSFLLSWLLRHLHHLEEQQQQTQKEDDDDNNNKTNKKTDKPWYEEYQTLGNDGFEWKGGSERYTTGIWMWSRPFFLRNNNSGNTSEPPLALLLIDTQGTFDHETTMSLTSSIFGFSSLLSSFQIYNVDKLIREDNLQNLALFAEYARMAVTKEQRSNNNNKEEETEEDATAMATTSDAPFQHVEFLVRDWQHFEDKDAPLDNMEQSMMDYLARVLQERDAADLKDTRSQIMACFEQVTCYGLCYPGTAVTKMKFTGDVAAMEELFVKLLDRYCQRVIRSLQPKKIHGRELTAIELSSYIGAYAKLFATGAKNFPTAVTMLEATASANNRNAVDLGLLEYNSRMDRVAGQQCSNFIRSEELEEEHYAAVQAALRAFGEIAFFGSDKAIAKAKQDLQEKIHESHKNYESLNDGRNPLKGMGLYLVPFFVVLVSYVVRTFLDFTCAPHANICRAALEAASHWYAVGAFFLLILAATRFQQVKEHVGRFQQALALIFNHPPSATSSKPKHE